MAVNSLLAVVLVFSLFYSCSAAFLRSQIVHAPQFNVTISLFETSAGNTTHPYIKWEQNPEHNKNDDEYNVLLIAIEEGVPNSSGNFQPLPTGKNSLAQNWHFTNSSIADESISVLLQASIPLNAAPQISDSLFINITVLLADTKGSNNFQAGDVLVKVGGYKFANTDDNTLLAVSYFFSTNNDDYNQSETPPIKGQNFQLGGAYFGPSKIKTISGINQLDTEPKVNQNLSGVGYLAVPKFDDGSAFVQQAYYGFGSGSKSHAGAIAAVVIILLIVVIVAAVIGFIIIRRRRRAYSAL